MSARTSTIAEAHAPRVAETRAPHRLVLAGIIAAGSASSILSSTVVSVAVPDLQRVFHASLPDVQWLMSAYLLGLAAVIPVSGWVSDRLGSSRAYLLTLGLFTVASILCGLASDIRTEIGLRALQGMAGGMIAPIGMTILLRSTPAEARARTVAMLGVPLMLAPALGPTVGGWLVQNFDWRLVFWINVPFCLIALVASAAIMPRSAPTPAGRLDWVGLILASPGVAILTYGITQAPSHGWLHPTTVLPIAIGLLCIGAFAGWSLRSRRPLLDMRVFADRGFSSSSLVGVTIAAGLFGVTFLMPSFIQQVQGGSPFESGLVVGAQGLGASGALLFSGRLADRYGPRPIVFFGIVVLALSSALMSTLGPGTPHATLAAMFAVRGLGMGFGMMPAWAAAYSTISARAVAGATATANTLQRIASSLGVAGLATILEAQLAAHVSPASLASASPAAIATATAHAYDSMLWISAAVTILALPATLLLQRPLPGGRIAPVRPRLVGAAAAVAALCCALCVFRSFSY